jgi:restriction system protein
MITEKRPGNWRELQDWTAKILCECGWTAGTEVTIKLARGKASIDVLATEHVQGRDYLTLIECKHWANPVPQAVAHSFRTVVAEAGANAGYIVSQAGFQSGAYEAVEHSNVKLLTWEEFQASFEEQWYWSYYVKDVLDPLCSYLEPLPAMASWDKYLDQEHVSRLVAMYRENFPLGDLIMSMHPVQGMIPGRRNRIILPLDDRTKDYGNLPENLYALTGYREFLDALANHALPLLDKFRSYRDMALERKKRAEPIDANHRLEGD